MPKEARTTIIKVDGDHVSDANDLLAIEEPLEIRLEYGSPGRRTTRNISVTMRTPGNDNELATGFLFTEGIIQSIRDVATIKRVTDDNENILLVSLGPDAMPMVDKLERNFYTTSSCGVCGKASIEAVRTVCTIPEPFDRLRVSSSVLLGLPELLRAQQAVFATTGGLHGCALFDTSGSLLALREDVGRHNALDKLIGAALSANWVPLSQHILLLSGRASFELVQKAVMAGIRIVAAVGAPSSLAAEMAEEWGMTLVGFLRGTRFNIYSGAERIVFLQDENPDKR